MSASADFIEQHQPNKFDIIRGDSKDKYYKSRQLALIKNILPSISVVAQVNNDQCRLISDCLYYSLTTLLGRQTLGEECYYLVEYGPLRTIPSLLQRALMVALKVYVPYITRRVSSLKLLRFFLTFCQKLNELIFMFSRKITYLNLENRVSRINYLSLNPPSSSSRVRDHGGLKLITAIKTINLAMFGANLVKAWRREAFSKSPVKNSSISTPEKNLEQTAPENERVDPTNKCSICLEMIRNPTLTSCGHLFCWQCVQNYALNVNNLAATFNCPSCRILVKSNKLIFLHNF